MVLLNRIHLTLESNELTVDQIMSKKVKDYGLISKDLYFNSIVINCMNNAEKMYAL